MVRLAWADRLRNEFKKKICTPSFGARCRVFIIVFGHASTSGSIYKTDSLFSASAVRGRRGWVVGLYIPCIGRMAVERCVGYFVILACSRDVWEKFSSRTSLNKKCLSALINDGRAIVEISLHTFLGICVWKCRVWWVWSRSFLCNGSFNVALINLENGLLRQPPPNANCFS